MLRKKALYPASIYQHNEAVLKEGTWNCPLLTLCQGIALERIKNIEHHTSLRMKDFLFS